MFLFVVFFFSITFWIATFTNSDVTDANKFKTALDESLSDMKSLLITAKL